MSNDRVRIFAKTLDENAKAQIDRMAESEAYGDCEIRIMPDAHAGAGCTIGTVIETKGKVVPETVGVDIGCGMLVMNLGRQKIDLRLFDEVVNENIPAGFAIREEATARGKDADSLGLWFQDYDADKAMKAIGTLGGGNHFIELDVDDEENIYLVIHSGSRNLGKLVCDHYQKKAAESCFARRHDKLQSEIAKLKAEGRHSEIQKLIDSFGSLKADKYLAYLEGQDLQFYISDMYKMQFYAQENRTQIAETILQKLGVSSRPPYVFETVHNYIDAKGVIRKGAVEAEKGMPLIIPMNMRDGSLICSGKGNPDWLCSAPHGAGRIMSRAEAYRKLTMEEFTEEMKGIYSTSVCQATIDESPMAYKPMDEIVAAIEPTVTIEKIIKPIYNFKAKEQTPLWKILKEEKKKQQ